MACLKDTVPALDRLLHLAAVNVKQKKTNFTPNEYTVTTPDDEVLFTMKEEGDKWTAFRKGHARGFHIDAVDNQGRLVFSLRRPMSFSSDKVEVTMQGALVSRVRMLRTCFKPVYSVNDASENPILRIKGEINLNNFQLQSTDKSPIGSITKIYRGFMKEILSFADDFVISFPVDLDVRYKVAVISACVLIDYRFHER